MTFSTIFREPGSGFTPLMEAAASGHEIIVQYLLDHVSRPPEKHLYCYFCFVSDRSAVLEQQHTGKEEEELLPRLTQIISFK